MKAKTQTNVLWLEKFWNRCFNFFCITQESHPVQMYRSGINGLINFFFVYLFNSAPMDDSSFTNDKYLPYYSGKRDYGKRDLGKWDISKCFRGDGTFILSGKRDILFSGRRETLFSGKQDILSSGNNFIVWESGHLSSGNRTSYPLGIETSSGNRDMGNRTHYPLGNILWESGIWEMYITCIVFV